MKADAHARARMSAFDRLPPAVRTTLTQARRDLDVRFLIDAIKDYAAPEGELLKLIEVKLARTK